MLIENFRNPLVSKWNFTIQQDLGWSSALEVSYIGSKGSRQLINWDPNIAANSPDSQCRCKFAASGIHSCAAASSRLRPSAGRIIMASPQSSKSATPHGLTMVSSYTWGHAFADTNTTALRRPGIWAVSTSPADSDANTRAPSWDIRHRFVTSFNYDLPFGRGKQFGAGMNPVAERDHRRMADQRHPNVLHRTAFHVPVAELRWIV